MSREHGRGQRVSRGKGRVFPPMTFDENVEWSLFENINQPHIYCQVLTQSRGNQFGRNMLSALHNFLTCHLKEQGRDKSLATCSIVEFSYFHRHASTSLYRLSHDVEIYFPPKIPSPSSLPPQLLPPLP